MKRIFAVLGVILTLVMMLIPLAAAETAEITEPVEAAEETEVPAEAPHPGEPLTWTYLATVSGATAATLLIVQFLKLPIDKVFGHIPTRIIVYIIALLIMTVATAFTEDITAEKALLAAVNAFVVALAAMGSYEVTFKKTEH